MAVTLIIAGESSQFPPVRWVRLVAQINNYYMVDSKIEVPGSTIIALSTPLVQFHSKKCVGHLRCYYDGDYYLTFIAEMITQVESLWLYSNKPRIVTINHRIEEFLQDHL